MALLSYVEAVAAKRTASEQRKAYVGRKNSPRGCAVRYSIGRKNDARASTGVAAPDRFGPGNADVDQRLPRGIWLGLALIALPSLAMLALDTYVAIATAPQPSPNREQGC